MAKYAVQVSPNEEHVVMVEAVDPAESHMLALRAWHDPEAEWVAQPWERVDADEPRVNSVEEVTGDE